MTKRVWIITLDLVELSLLDRDPMGLHNKTMMTEIDDRDTQGKQLTYEFERMIDAVLRLDRKMSVGEE